MSARKNSQAPAFVVKTIRPTLSAMRFGLDRLSFEVGVPAGRACRGAGMIVLPSAFFDGHVKEIVEQVIRDHFPVLEAHCLVGLFTGQFGGPPNNCPTFSSRSTTIHVLSGAGDLTEFAMAVALALKAETILVVPWNSSAFKILSANTPS